MAHFLLRYELASDYLARRGDYRDAHLALAWRAANAGTLLLGGAVGDPVESALLLFNDSGAARAFAEADPYVTAGLVTAWRVLPWATVTGETCATPVRPAQGPGP
ncbi:MAG: hypothetical protein KF730_13795 [Sphingomonas sp.]|uniref:YciI-like protein n=1 Tax=Sphingomonas sp. TaxID=28214 RepID=UPI0025D7615C|nr:YciI-like protein [Sphingomonas sp.]MBX3565637.1 hypothetical protein [Sphingomonas sp.]